MQQNIANPLILEESLKNKVVKGTFWIFISQIATQLFALVKNIVVARALSPNDFGLFGVALVAISLFDVSSQTGFDAALIQKKDNIEEYLDTAFVVNIIRGVILFILLFFSAPLVSIFFKNEAVIPIVRVIGFNFLINGFVNPGTIYFAKELDFKKQFFWDASKTISDVLVTLFILFFIRNVWVLVISSVSSYLVRMIVSYLINSFRPKFRFRKHYALNLFKFGKWILGTSIITFLFNQGDDAFLGKILGVTSLGFYQIAYRIGQLPATEFAKVLSQVTFPAYSKLQDDFFKLKEGFLKTLNITAIFMIPLTGGIFILAPEFTQIFLTHKWTPIIPVLRVLVIAGMIRALVTTGGALFQGKGEPKIDYKMNLFRLLAMVVTIYPLTLFFNMTGVALAVALGNLACVPIWFIETVKIISASLKDYLKIIVPPLLGTVVMCSLLLLLKRTIEVNLLSFIFMAIIAIGVYLALMYLLEKILNLKTFDDLKSLIDSFIED